MSTAKHHVQPQNNPWFGLSMVLIGIVIGFLAANITSSGGSPTVPNAPSAPTEAPSAENLKAVDIDNEHIRGNKNAKVAVIEYSDFECPFCARVHPTYEKIIADYGDDVMWVYRHFPLSSIHPNAQKAAEASECAAELGGNDAFWEMADLLVEQGTAYEQYAKYAAQIGLDAADFDECVSSGKYAEKVASDQQSGSAAGVNGTPGNFVYNMETKEGKFISGAQPFEAFKAAIDPYLN